MNRRRILATIVQLLVACLAVGLALSFLGVDRTNVLDWLRGLATDTVGTARWFVAWAWRYVALGAAVVIPVWLVVMAFRLVRGRR